MTGETDPDMAAAELALGVLDGTERAAALRRVLAEPGFAGDVDRWRDRFAGLFARWPEAQPSPDLLARIEARIDGKPLAVTGLNWRWPAATAAMSAIAASLLFVLLLRPAVPPVPVGQPAQVASAQAPMLFAAVMQKDARQGGAEMVKAVYNPNTGMMRLTAGSMAKTGRAAELWVIAKDGVPHSLGLVPRGDNMLRPVRMNMRPMLATGATLAVSIEPEGGSPTGLPTGPVVATGALSEA